MLNKKIIVIGGPTASYKSELALNIAKEYNGIIINADAIQVYKDIPILSARPSLQDIRLIDHKLYGEVDALERYSVAIWLEKVIKEINLAHSLQKIPIIVGGTGMYLFSLMKGFTAIPAISKDVKENVQNEIKKLGINAIYDKLLRQDYDFAIKINKRDQVRIIRAYEVIQQTGKTPNELHKENKRIFYDSKQYVYIYSDICRKILYDNCNMRFIQMINNGAIEEIESLLAKDIPLTSPIFKAIGAQEIASYLSNKIAKAEMIDKAQQLTRNFAKRQTTWFRNQAVDSLSFSYKDQKELNQMIVKLSFEIEK